MATDVVYCMDGDALGHYPLIDIQDSWLNVYKWMAFPEKLFWPPYMNSGILGLQSCVLPAQHYLQMVTNIFTLF